MIVVTRLNGPPLAINCDLIERIEETPDTILTLVDGTKYVVQEAITEIVERIREFRASVIIMAQKLEIETSTEPSLHVIHGNLENISSEYNDNSNNLEVKE